MSKHTPHALQPQLPFGDTCPNPSGLCWCGCGQKTRIADRTSEYQGCVKGQPQRYILGHRHAPYKDSLAEAFLSRCSPGEPDDCWLWEHLRNPRGYGVFKFRNRGYLAHRVAYELHYGPIPVGDNFHDSCICHSCDQPACFNWAHLWLGTLADNMHDMAEKGRHADVRGEQNGRAKLTELDVIEIRRLYAQGVPAFAVARQFELNKGTVYRIISRKSWKNIP